MRLLALALVLALTAAGAGCIQVQVGAPTPSETPEPAASSTSTSAKPGPLKAEFTWTPQTPRVGQPVRFEGKAEGLDGRRVDAWSWDFGDNKTARVQSPTHTYAKAGEWTVTFRLMTTDGRIAHAVHRVFVLNVGSAPGIPSGNQSVNQTPAPPPTPGVFECGDTRVVEEHDTFGRDDGGLSWAVLKTGFRLAVVWTSEEPTTETLRYSVGGTVGQDRTVTELAPSTLHLFVVDGLPQGKWVCFKAGDRPLHAVRLANAMTAFQPGDPHGTYTVNYLALVNEGGDMAEVEDGLARYADLLWDATDGWVRAGALLVVSGDYLHHNSGWVTCYTVRFTSPACNRIFDVVVTEDAVPYGAASTYRRGVTDADVAIWMNMHAQAMPGPLTMDDFGSVLVHESGHYLFDMADLYGDPVVPDSAECDVPALGISIMGGSRDATEFDDEVNRCPSQGSGYVPSWTLLRGQFKEIAERPQINAGPSGNGGVAFVQAYSGL